MMGQKSGKITNLSLSIAYCREGGDRVWAMTYL